ncbi:hypothetical protein SPRG_08443 [Saprolegnia parasitica CBS 223.65]|uniref:Uncharacterized protein n=1 Tax=Saprolegnia parasitica (strain CBS 223.65) TaxID=695850 RepID=A0A067CGZ2_SAPPC|nr:hypothetical protein SPRG_08443 [Saprolegnia parasitica CBS 223.65]KDO26082.1 hypothetical protein SPRG_08443 [Saprolegnia parasitica CBS 223.65]|eukprot:XP_012203078.1 hypothetical protein SPRG_08443 [Saprolegnia parasitica CBS 223.65]
MPRALLLPPSHAVLGNPALVREVVAYQGGMTHAVRTEYQAWRAFVTEMQEDGMYSVFGLLRSMLLSSLTDTRFMLHQAIIENRPESVLCLVEHEPKWITPSAFTLARQRGLKPILHILHEHTSEVRQRQAARAKLLHIKAETMQSKLKI